MRFWYLSPFFHKAKISISIQCINNSKSYSVRLACLDYTKLCYCHGQQMIHCAIFGYNKREYYTHASTHIRTSTHARSPITASVSEISHITVRRFIRFTRRLTGCFDFNYHSPWIVSIHQRRRYCVWKLPAWKLRSAQSYIDFDYYIGIISTHRCRSLQETDVI